MKVRARTRVRVRVRVMMRRRAIFTVRVKVCRMWVRRLGQGREVGVRAKSTRWNLEVSLRVPRTSSEGEGVSECEGEGSGEGYGEGKG